MFDISSLGVPLDAPTLGNGAHTTELICVCCNCDRVRGRSGQWHADSTPLAGERRSHGICPECFVELYPEYAEQSTSR
jgi:hypothetical protein